MVQLSQCRNVVLASLLMLVACLGSGLPAQSQTASNTKDSASASSFPFQGAFTPPGDGRPKKTRGAGARDGLRCSQDSPVMRALMPPGNYGLTLQERPEVLLDLAGEVVPKVVLAFKDETGVTLARVNMPVHSTKAIQSFALPESITALKVGKNYQWSLLVACDGTVNPSHPIFSGWVQRVEKTPYMADYLGRKPVLEQVAWFARYGYWYDAVATLNQGLDSQANNPNFTQVWDHLLEFVNTPAD